MKVIVGLGNPGKEYAETRHNVGWWFIDHLADVWRFEGWRKDGVASVCAGRIGNTPVRLVKPLTFMNLSGEALRPYLRRPFWSAQTDLLIVLDEVALPLGSSRYRAKGSPGGHNGLKSVQHEMKTADYARLRIGIRPEDERRIGDLSDFVLDRFGRDEAEITRATFPAMAELCDTWVRGGDAAVQRLLSQRARPSSDDATPDA
ncbi:MAG: aminoacyl-tRNA hydrolase [Gemmatimonadaceae bacterium]|nr:aminoacyl-tRNA hydrolase [Gemmatimonadaceae bacterium]